MKTNVELRKKEIDLIICALSEVVLAPATHADGRGKITRKLSMEYSDIDVDRARHLINVVLNDN